MKRMTVVALMLTLGAAGLYAQDTTVNMTVSGTAEPSTVNLQTGTGTAEYRLAGRGTLGPFTLLAVSSSAANPQANSNCSGLYIPVLAGRAVLRLQDGSLLSLKLTGGSDCINFAAGFAICTRIFQVLSGTGRMQGASGGTITLTEKVVPVVPGTLSFFAVTGDVTGAISGVAEDADRDAQQ